MPDFLTRRLREIVFFSLFFAVWIHSLPKKPQFLQPYPLYYWSGLWQNWDMFAPTPVFESHIFTADFLLNDDSHVKYNLPNHHSWEVDPPYSGIILERFRKWAPEAIIRKGNEHLKAPAVYFAAKQLHIDEYKRATLTQYWVNVHTVPPILNSTSYTNVNPIYDSRKKK
ncbi:MAG: hypothetical protein KA715_06710 [Xanthomonadaceae bacterium]|nr:hypothetical protein [Xanthomonadaceae bacterium]